MRILIFGHKNPDTDSVCAAISLSYLKNQVGFNSEPRILGPLKKETKWVLNKWKVKEPKLIENVSGKKVILVDHNNFSESAFDIEKAEILEVVDHHRINFSYHSPIDFIVKPYGSTCTIIYELFKKNRVDVPLEILGLILSAIISDTSGFKSSSTTDNDLETAEEIAKLLEINLDEFKEEILKIKTDISGKSINELLNYDFKKFLSKAGEVGIAQIEVNNFDLLKRKKEILKEMKEMKKNVYHTLCFIISNIIENKTILFILSDDLEKINKIFKGKIKNNEIEFNKLLTRKLDIVPMLLKALE